jgi:hypothetical protein
VHPQSAHRAPGPKRRTRNCREDVMDRIARLDRKALS